MAGPLGWQVLFLAGAAALGLGVGLLYDLFRVMRVRIPLPLLGGVLDLLFWLVVTAGLFVYTTAAGNGEVRLYTIGAVLLGAVVYFWLASRWVLKGAYAAADLVAILWKLITFPLRILLLLSKKLEETAKKSFHYRRKWYKIKLLSREMDERFSCRPRGGMEKRQGAPAFCVGHTHGIMHRRQRT